VGVGFDGFEADIMLPTPTSDWTLSELGVTAVPADSDLVLFLNVFMQLAEGFWGSGLVMKTLPPGKTSAIVSQD
jgi:hypothetical protein